MEGTCFVFPSRRAAVFFRKHLCSLAAAAHRPMKMPLLLTVEDFFQKASGLAKSDRVDLLLTLYDCYAGVNPSAEPLDDFIFWGDVLLGDFSDLDKYMVDAGALLLNISELRAMQDSFSYLTDDQRAAIEHFVSHFNDASPVEGVKGSFRKIWDILLPLYRSFRERLKASGMAYEGMVYRSVAEKMRSESAVDVLGEAFPGTGNFVFVGLNVLSTAEKVVLKKMKDASLALFCWDYSSAMIRDKHNRSSFFMDSNIELLGQSYFPDEGGLPDPCFNVVGVPSAVGQAKLLPKILDGRGADTAIVIPEEGLLGSVLNSIPENIEDINVTMGFPLSESVTAAFVCDLCALQMHITFRKGEYFFYHKNVGAIFSSAIFKAAMDDSARAMADGIRKEARYYVPQSAFAGNSLMERIFRPVVEDPKASSPGQIRAFGEYLEDAIRAVIPEVMKDMPQEAEFARRYVECLHHLHDRDLPVKPATYIRLLERIVAGESVPYNGEPVGGLQIMGPLEMRALDFDTLVILSCNEGIFPRHSVSSSFIPPELRKGFGLPTYEYQDAMWSYYFYRMIQRSSQVWMLYDSRTEKLRPGEESRYIKQLEYHFGANIHRYVSVSSISSEEGSDTIPKPADMAERLAARPLSASSLQNWLSCQAKFYYGFIEGLEKEDEVAESLDAGMIGNVYHKTMQALYTSPEAMAPDFNIDGISSLKGMDYVTSEYLAQWEKRPADIKARVRTLIMKELHSVEVTGRNLVLEDVILRYVLKTISRDRELLASRGCDKVRILGLEKKRTWKFGGYDFVGFIDRLDSFEDGTVRIVDYKTGRVTEDDVRIDDGNADAVLEALFGDDNKKRPKIALQLFLYDMMVSDSMGIPLSGIENVVYPASKMFTAPPPSSSVSPAFCNGVKERLTGLLSRMEDLSQPIERTSDRDTCSYCDFKNICGR